MRKTVVLAVMAVLAMLDWQASAAVAKKKAPAKKSSVTAKKSSAKRSAAVKAAPRKASGTASSRTATARAASSKRTKKPVAPKVTWRNRQTSPAPERYREIQEALAAKGYLGAGDADGSWNAASVEALKRFQADQNLDASGKINSLSLIALGLGPKRETAAAKAPEVDSGPANR